MIPISASILEQQIFEIEGIRIVIRCNKDLLFEPYPYKRKASRIMTLYNWIATRVKTITENYEVEVIHGNGTIPHQRTVLKNLRDSYIK